MEPTIIRQYPPIKDTRVYTDRYNKDDFERYNEITQKLENYEKWKLGINNATNRKIRIGGKTHAELGAACFYIHHGTRSFLFTELDGLHMKLYMDETEKLRQCVEEHNSNVYETICKINALQQWDDYIVFEEQRYGIPHVHANIHRENDCLGVIAESSYESCRCHCCEDWGGCSNPSGTQHYACEKCDYKYSTVRNHSKNYKGK